MSLNDERSRYEQGFRDGVVILSERLSSHYPHSNSILCRIEVEVSELLQLTVDDYLSLVSTLLDDLLRDEESEGGDE